jgi:hypothetical protein
MEPMRRNLSSPDGDWQAEATASSTRDAPRRRRVENRSKAYEAGDRRTSPRKTVVVLLVAVTSLLGGTVAGLSVSHSGVVASIQGGASSLPPSRPGTGATGASSERASGPGPSAVRTTASRGRTSTDPGTNDGGRHSPAVGLGVLGRSGPDSSSGSYYLQEPMPLQTVYPATAMTALTAAFLVPANSEDTGDTGTGYELNALTNTGDWIQLVVSDNWPGCSGISWLYEIWDNALSSVEEKCVGSGPSLHDSVELSTALNCVNSMEQTDQICLDFYDLSTGTNYITTYSQPDPTATYFAAGGVNGNGYFTGIMTESATTTGSGSPSSCSDLPNLPPVSYKVQTDFVNVQSYWSAGNAFFNPSGTTTEEACTTYTPLDELSHLSADDPTLFNETDVTNADWTAHFEGAQNESSPEAGGQDTYRFATDVTPLYIGVDAPSNVDLGQEISIDVDVVGGTPSSDPDTACIFTVDGASQSGTWGSCADWEYTPSGTGTYATWGETEDAFGDVAYGNVAHTTVYADPTQSLPEPDQPSADLGQTVTFTANVAGGSGGGTYAWSPPMYLGCATSTTNVIDCVPNAVPPGGVHYEISYQWTDSNGVAATGSTGLAFPVYLDPTQAPPTPNPASVDVGQAVGFTASVLGGAPLGGTYAWTFSTFLNCTGTTSATLSCVPKSAGPYPVSYLYTDSNGVIATGNSRLTFTVDPDPSVTTPTANRTSSDAGQSVTFTTTLSSAGAGTDAYAWSVTAQGGGSASGLGCAASTSLTVTCTAPTIGTYTVFATVTDANGFTSPASWANITFQVFAPVLVQSFAASPSSFTVGTSSSLTVGTVGGAPPLSYAYSGLPDGCTAPPSSDASFTCAPTKAGTYQINVTVTDANGVRSSKSVDLTVNNPSPSPLAVGGTDFWIVLAVVVLVAAAIAGLAWQRARRARGGGGPPEHSPPS